MRKKTSIPWIPSLSRTSDQNTRSRHNLDPTGVYEDSELWEALERVQLKDLVTELPEGLAALASNIGIEEGGSVLA